MCSGAIRIKSLGEISLGYDRPPDKTAKFNIFLFSTKTYVKIDGQENNCNFMLKNFA